MKKRTLICRILIVLFIMLTPISSNIGALKPSDDIQNIDNNLVLRTRYFEKGELCHVFESKNSFEKMKQLEIIIEDMEIAFKEKDTSKLESYIDYLKDNQFIDKSLHESCLDILSKSTNTNSIDKIEDKYSLVFVYSNRSYNMYFSEMIFGLIFTNIYLKLREIGFSGEIFFKLFNEILYGIVLIRLIRLFFIKPIAPAIISLIYDGFVYSLGPNGFGSMNADDYEIGIGAAIGPFSGITIDILTPDEEYVFISKFLFIFGISGIVLVDEILPWP